MDLAFSDKSLRELCESQLKAEREFGVRIANKLRARLADLHDAKSINDVVAASTKKLNSGQGQMAIELCDGAHLIFCANHVKNPQTKNGEIDWPKVSRIKLLRIEDVYES